MYIYIYIHVYIYIYIYRERERKISLVCPRLALLSQNNKILTGSATTSLTATTK